jgi:hypothetical protein
VGYVVLCFLTFRILPFNLVGGPGGGVGLSPTDFSAQTTARLALILLVASSALLYYCFLILY